MSHPLLVRAEAKRKEAAALLDFEAEGAEDLTTEEIQTRTTQAKALREEADALDEARTAAEDEGAKNRQALEGYDQGTGRKTAPDLPTSTVSVGKAGHEDDPKHGFKTPREFMLSVMEYGKGKQADERLVPLLATVGSDEAGTYSDPYGGALIPAGFQPTLLSIPSEADPVAGMVRRVPMQTPTLKMPARVDQDHSDSVSGGLRVYRTTETEDVTASRMQFKGVELKVSPLMGIAYGTQDILTDSPISFASLIADGFADEFAAKIMAERISGLGGGEFAGILNAACTVSITKETSQTAATIVLKNVLKMVARGWRPQMWLANRAVIPQLAQLTIDVGTGGSPIFMMNAQGPFPGTLLGLPIAFTEHCPTLGTVGDLILCNWGEYLEATYGGMERAESIHVRFVNRESTFRFYLRNDGRPWWSAALTPKNGDSQSPFVTLASRS